MALKTPKFDAFKVNQAATKSSPASAERLTGASSTSGANAPPHSANAMQQALQKMFPNAGNNPAVKNLRGRIQKVRSLFR